MTIPDWVSSYSDTDLERRFGAETVARGQSYAEDGRVRAIRSAGDLVMATVLGSAREAYQCSVVATAGPTSLVATCTCPVRRDCKHAAALLLDRPPLGRTPGAGLCGSSPSPRWCHARAAGGAARPCWHCR